MAEKWYNSSFFEYFGGGLGMAAVIAAIGIAINLGRDSPERIRALAEAAAIRQGKGHILHERNVVGGPEKDKFFETSLGRAYLEIDGEPVEKYLEESSDRR